MASLKSRCFAPKEPRGEMPANPRNDTTYKARPNISVDWEAY